MRASLTIDVLAPQRPSGSKPGGRLGLMVTVVLLLALCAGADVLHGRTGADTGVVSRSPQACGRVGSLLFGTHAGADVGSGWLALPGCEIRFGESVLLGFEHQTLAVQLYLDLLDGRPPIGVTHSELFNVMVKGSDVDCDLPEIRGLLAVVEDALEANEKVLARFLADDHTFRSRIQSGAPGPFPWARRTVRFVLSSLWIGLCAAAAALWLSAFFGVRGVRGEGATDFEMASEGVLHRGWMDFGGAFESIFRRICRFILVVWAKNSPKNGPNDTRKAPPILCNTPSSAVLVALAWLAGLAIRLAAARTEPLFLLDGKDYSLTGVTSLLFVDGGGSLFHTPLYGWFQTFVRFFDADAFSGSAAFRWWTVPLSSLSIPAVWYAVSRFTGNWKVAVLCAFVVATSPFELDLGLRSHAYVITQTALFGSWAACAWFCERPVLPRASATVFLASLAIWSNPLAAVGVVCLLCFAVLDRSSRSVPWDVVAMAVAICMLCAPLVHMILRGLVAYVAIAGARPGGGAGSSMAEYLPLASVVLLAVASAAVGLLIVRRARRVGTGRVVLSVGLLAIAAILLGVATGVQQSGPAADSARHEQTFSPRSSFQAGRPVAFVAAFSPPFMHSNHHFIEYFSPQESVCKAPRRATIATVVLLVAAAGAIVLVNRDRVGLVLAHGAGLLTMLLLSRAMFVRSVNLGFLAVGGLMVLAFGLEKVRHTIPLVVLGVLLVLAQLVWTPNVLTGGDLLPALALEGVLLGR